jgi:hypothetical protein
LFLRCLARLVRLDLDQLSRAETICEAVTRANMRFVPTKTLKSHWRTSRSRSHRLWRKNLVDQSIIRSFERVDESDALQDEPILQIFSEQTPHAGTLRRSPQHRVPERQSVSSNSLKRGRKIVVGGRLYWEYSTPSIDRPSDVLDWYSRLSDRHIGELRKGLKQ